MKHDTSHCGKLVNDIPGFVQIPHGGGHNPGVAFHKYRVRNFASNPHARQHLPS